MVQGIELERVQAAALIVFDVEGTRPLSKGDELDTLRSSSLERFQMNSIALHVAAIVDRNWLQEISQRGLWAR